MVAQCPFLLETPVLYQAGDCLHWHSWHPAELTSTSWYLALGSECTLSDWNCSLLLPKKKGHWYWSETWLLFWRLWVLLFVGLQARLITISNFLFTKLCSVVHIRMKQELIHFIFILLFITNMCYICVIKCHVCIGAHGEQKRRASLETATWGCKILMWVLRMALWPSGKQPCTGLLRTFDCTFDEILDPFLSSFIFFIITESSTYVQKSWLKETEDRLQPGIAQTIIILPTEDVG